MSAMHFAETIRNLEILEIFEYYDTPLFFSARSSADTNYLVICAETQDDYSVWLYCAVSPGRLRAIRTGRVAIREAFLNPEEGYLAKAIARGSDVECAFVLPDSVDDNQLPEPDERLSLKDSLVNRTASAVDVAAKNRKAQVLDVGISVGTESALIPSISLGAFLNGLQATVQSLALDQQKPLTRVPDHVKFETQLFVTELFQSSYGIRFESRDSAEFPLEVNQYAVSRLLSLIEAGETPETLRHTFEALNILSRSRYLRFLKALEDMDMSLVLTWANAAGIRRQTEAKLPRIRQNIAYLESNAEVSKREISRSGMLVGIRIESLLFDFRDESGEMIKGKISNALAEEWVRVKHEQFHVPANARVDLIEEIEINDVTGKEKWTYTMVGISFRSGK